jgi:xanthine dehydrogenase accessory factor
MQQILSEIVRRCAAGEAVVLCTVVSTRGSTPQRAGARMLVTADGRTIGTLGGGCVEAEVRRRATEMLAQKRSQLMEFRLDHDYGWDDGLICGGIMDIFMQSIGPGEQEPFARILGAIERDAPAQVTLVYEQSGEQKQFVEELRPGARLIIAGAGHVAQALAEVAGRLDFRITVIDDRADFASESRFPTAQRIVGDIEEELRRCPIDRDTYVVIVTRGHNRDGAALAAVIERPARYVGLIGSKRKIKTIFDDLHGQGISIDHLKRVHAPVGLDIGAVSVPEIAVSIAAELVAVRREQGGKAAQSMRIDSKQLEQWLARRS